MLEDRDSPKNMREIGRELGVATLLEGRVQPAGNMVRINVQLIDAETDAHIWSEIYDDELTAENIFTIQSGQPDQNSVETQLRVVYNWFEDLKRLAPSVE